MLHKKKDVILPATLALLERLQCDEDLSAFFLVGGTSLALQIGHRFSVDLDLFTLEPFDTQALVDHLNTNYAFQLSSVARNTLMGVIEGVKVDFIRHAYPLVLPILEIDGLRLVSKEDIGAMKLNVIAHNGQRLKDFIDVYYLLELVPLQSLLDSYAVKYQNSNIMIPLKGLTYFDDLDLKMDPPILSKEISVEAIKKRLRKAVEEPDRVFK